MQKNIEGGSPLGSDPMPALVPLRPQYEKLLDPPRGRPPRKASAGVPDSSSIPAVRTGRPRGPGPDPQIRRQELLEAAIRAVHRLGPSVSMGDIAAEARLTKPTVYACFKSKAGLGRAILEHYLIQARKEALLAMSGEQSRRGVVRAIVAPLVAFVEREPDVYRFLIVALGTSASTRSPSLFGPVDMLAEELSMGFDIMFKRSGADPRPAGMLAYSVLAAAFASVEWWHHRIPRVTSAEEITEWISDFICGGLSHAGLA